MSAIIWGKNKTKEGVAPAVALCNPKNARNVGAALRACSCFGIKQLWFTGNRVPLEGNESYRLPREERMKGRYNVELRNFDYFFEQFDRDVTPVAVELRKNSELLPQFAHPEKPLYVFGPEDGSIEQVMLRHCHRFVDNTWGYVWKHGAVTFFSPMTEKQARMIAALSVYLYAIGVHPGLDHRLATAYILQGR